MKIGINHESLNVAKERISNIIGKVKHFVESMLTKNKNPILF